MPQLYVRTDFTSILYSFILVFLLTLSPLIQMFSSLASAAVERRFLLLMSSSSPISVPTFFEFLYSLPDLDSVVCSVLSALTSKLYFFNVFCTLLYLIAYCKRTRLKQKVISVKVRYSYTN